MFCSHCGMQLPEGRRVCDQCRPRQPGLAPAPGVHPACHAIAIMVGIGVAMGLFGLWRIATLLMTQPRFAQSARFTFLIFPVSVHVHMMITVALMVTTVVCVIGLYSGNRKAWAVLLCLRALFLPLSLYSLYVYVSFVIMRPGAYGFGMYGTNFSFLLNMLMIFSGPLFDVVVIVLLLKYKRRLVR